MTMTESLIFICVTAFAAMLLFELVRRFASIQPSEESESEEITAIASGNADADAEIVLSQFGLDASRNASGQRILGLVVDINTYRESPLRWCNNDGDFYVGFLKTLGARQANILRLSNDAATTKNIKRAMARVLEVAQKGDYIVDTYSGHGTKLPCTTEADGTMEMRCPVDIHDDFDSNNISDDFYRAWAAELEKKGAFLITISDSCHSGDSTRDIRNTAKFLVPPENAKVARTRNNAQKDAPVATEQKNVLLFSGCRANEVSYEFAEKRHGALTFAFKETVKNGIQGRTAEELHRAIAEIVTGAFPTQHPQLEGSQTMMKQPFLQ